MVRGCGKQIKKGNRSWAVAQMGTWGTAVVCWELQAMAAP